MQLLTQQDKSPHRAPLTLHQAPPIKTDDRRLRIVGLLILLVIFGVFGTWAAVAKLASAALAPGVVTVEGYRKTVQHLEGGIVKEILVRDGDLVEPGDVLLRLDETQVKSKLEIARSRYFAAVALEARLLAEREQAEEIGFPQELQDYREQDTRVAETMAIQHQVFEARRAALVSEAEILEQRIEQLNEQIRGLEGLTAAKQRRIESYREEIRDLTKLFKRGLGDRLRLREMERAANELEGEQADHRAAIASARVKIGETRLQMLQLKQEFQKEVVAELRQVQTEIFDLQEQLRALNDTVARTEIQAPARGAVVGMGVHTVGGVISPASPILDIVPRDEELVVEARVQPTDIDNVYPGLEADVRFSAFKSRTTPVVQGAVETVSADRLTDDDGQPYYLARIAVAEGELERLGELKVLPGMPAEVMIKTGERTFVDYLLQPILDGLNRSFREE